MAGIGRISVQGIDEEMWSEFKENVIEKYGKLHTVLGLEVEKALREYMSGNPQGANTHTHQKKEEKTEYKENLEQESKTKIPKGIAIGKTRKDRINNIGEMLMHGSAEITGTGLQRFIATQGVGDGRVIESYIRTMKLKGWVVAQGNDARVVVSRSIISEALDIQLLKETPEKIRSSYEISEQVEGNGGRR